MVWLSSAVSVKDINSPFTSTLTHTHIKFNNTLYWLCASLGHATEIAGKVRLYSLREKKYHHHLSLPWELWFYECVHSIWMQVISYMQMKIYRHTQTTTIIWKQILNHFVVCWRWPMLIHLDPWYNTELM